MTSPTTIAHADWFRWPETQAIFSCLNSEGYETRAVGGAVRNALLNEAVHDVDFATTAPPEETMRIAAAAGFNPVPTGLAHGTVTVIVNGVPFEVTTLRRDVETDGRRATVAFGTDWEADARRRDFTMNALYAMADGTIYDPLAGLSDVVDRRVRFIGDARARIREDYLRILRFFRFSAFYQVGSFDAEGVDASIAERGGLRRLAAERIQGELLRLLTAPRAPEAVRVMDEAGLLLRVLGGIIQTPRLRRLISIEQSLGLPPDPIRRLAAAAVFVEEDAARIAARLKLSTVDAAHLAVLARSIRDYGLLQSPLRLKSLLYHIGQKNGVSALLLAWAERGDPDSSVSWNEAFTVASKWVRPDFPIRGGDLIALGFKPGPALGQALGAMEDAWVQSQFTLSKAQLLATISPKPIADSEVIQHAD